MFNCKVIWLAGARERIAPTTYAPAVESGAFGKTWWYGQTFTGTEIIPDRDPLNPALWVKTITGGYVALTYLGMDRLQMTPSTVKTYRILHDWEIPLKYKFVRSNVPEVHFLVQNHYSQLTREWQEFWFSLNGGDPKDVKQPFLKEWQAYTNSRAFITDYKGPDLYRDYISQERLAAGLPEIKALACGGNLIKGEEYIGQGGKRWILIQTMNGREKPPVGVTYFTHPHLVHVATNVVRGVNKANPFPTRGGRNTGLSVFYPLVAKNPVSILADYVKEVGDTHPNPYVPPMEIK